MRRRRYRVRFRRWVDDRHTGQLVRMVMTDKIVRAQDPDDAVRAAREWSDALDARRGWAPRGVFDGPDAMTSVQGYGAGDAADDGIGVLALAGSVAVFTILILAGGGVIW